MLRKGNPSALLVGMKTGAATVKKSKEFPQNIKNRTIALAGVAQWIECWPMNQRVTGSIPRQGTCLCCGSVPSGRHVRSNHTLRFLSFSFSLPPLSLKINT